MASTTASKAAAKKPAKKAATPTKAAAKKRAKAILNATETKKLTAAVKADISRAEKVVARLDEQIDQIVRNIGSGDSDFDEEGGEGASTLFDLDRLRSDRANEADYVNRLTVTLDALAAGTYGSCEDCDTAIPFERLEAILGTTLCVQCKASR